MIISHFQAAFVRSELSLQTCIWQVRKLQPGEAKVAPFLRGGVGLWEGVHLAQQPSEGGLWTCHQSSRPRPFRGLCGQNPLHNNTNALFTFSIVLTLALLAQKQWQVKLLVPQKKIQFVINDVNYLSGSNIFPGDMRTSVKHTHKTMKFQKIKLIIKAPGTITWNYSWGFQAQVRLLENLFLSPWSCQLS